MLFVKGLNFSIFYLFFLLSFFAASCGGKEEEFQIPNPPDLSYDIEAFNNPDADLNQENIISAINNAKNSYEFIQQLKIFQPLIESISNSLEELANKDQENSTQNNPFLSQSEESSESGFNLSTYIELSSICPGLKGSIPDPEKNGNFLLKSVINDDNFYPVFWGDIKKCILDNSGKILSLTGSISIYLDELDKNKRFQSTLGEKGIFFKSSGIYFDEKLEEERNYNLNFIYNSLLKTLRVLNKNKNGSLVFITDTEDPKKDIKIRARNGSFDCNWSSKICKDSSSNNEISW